MKKLTRRTAETLMEVVTAMSIFGIISVIIFEFMANQALHLAHIRDRENMLYAAQKLITCSSFDHVPENTPKPIANTGIQYTLHDNTLKLLKGDNSMTFKVFKVQQ